MGYVNERVPEEEKKAYMIPGYKEITPFCWTIDKEKNIKLFDYWTNIDNPKEIHFAMIWNEIVVDIVLVKNVKGNSVRWDLKGISIPDSLLSIREEVIDELRQAIRTFGLFGYEIRKTVDVETVANF